MAHMPQFHISLLCRRFSRSAFEMRKAKHCEMMGCRGALYCPLQRWAHSRVVCLRSLWSQPAHRQSIQVHRGRRPRFDKLALSPFVLCCGGRGRSMCGCGYVKGCTLRPENIRCPALSLSASLPWDHMSHYTWHVASSCSSAGDWQAPATLLSLPPSVTAVDMQEAVPEVLRWGLEPHSSCWDSNCPSSWIISLTPKTLDLVLLCLVTTTSTETERTMVLSQAWWCMLFTPGWQRWAGLCGAEAVSVCVESSKLGKAT